MDDEEVFHKIRAGCLLALFAICITAIAITWLVTRN